jgi:hypothetical protein
VFVLVVGQRSIHYSGSQKKVGWSLCSSFNVSLIYNFWLASKELLLIVETMYNFAF